MHGDMSDAQLMGARPAAKMLGISYPTLLGYVKSGMLPLAKIEGVREIVFSSGDIQEFMASQSTKALAAVHPPRSIAPEVAKWHLISEVLGEDFFNDSISEILTLLPPRDADLISRRFGIATKAQTLAEVGACQLITREAIRGRQKRILRNLRKATTTKAILAKAFVASLPKPVSIILSKCPKCASTEIAAENDNFRFMATSIDELELGVRAYNCLRNAGIQTVGDLVQKSEIGLLRTRHFGRKSLNEIKELLSGMGLQLGMELSITQCL